MDTRHTNVAGLVLRFGTFEFRPARMLLLERGKPVRLGNRALDILRILIERAGEVVTKEELIQFTWPTTVVEEGNLRVHIGALRRALHDGDGGSRYIVNVVGRGYSFVAEVRREAENEAEASPGAPSSDQNDLPAPLTRMLGRGEDVTALLELLRSSRLVTVVGPGGVGKSTLALEVASSLVDSYRERARFIDLAAVAKPELVPQSFATALGMVVPANNAVAGLVAFLRDKEVLLLLDNCEHVIDAAAAISEAILKGATAVRILATSREPLRIQGERQHRLHPLHVPPADASITATSARQYPSVALFAERASTSSNPCSFELTDANAALVGNICRRLDGIPLAIELAAARVGLLGARDLLGRLDEQLLHLASGRRTSTARHQTLRAALDWSYSLLSLEEQAVLRRLSVFSAVFTLDSAVAVAAHGELSEAQVVDAMMSLAEKSLLTADAGDPEVRYRLLRTTQSYAHEKLAATEDYTHISRWHAQYVLKLLRRGDSDWDRMTRTAWVRAYDYAVDDVRAALQWAFTTPGNLELAVDLTIAAVPFAFQMALIEEIRDRLTWVSNKAAELQPALQARLSEALDSLNNNMEATRRDSTTTTALRENVTEPGGPPKLQLGPLVQLTIIQIEDGEYRAALASSGRLEEMAQAAGDTLAELMSDRVKAQAQHFYGNHSLARTLAERVIANRAKSVPLAYMSVQVDHRVSMRIVLARIHWICGYPDRAREVVEEALEYATADTPFAVCQTLALAACPIAFWCGDVLALENFVPRLIEEADRFRLGNWRVYGECYARLLSGASRGNKAEIVRLTSDKRLLRQTVATVEPQQMGWATLEPERTSDSTEGWCAPELLRIRAVHLQPRTESLLQQSLELARSQGAASWGLRTAMSLSGLYERQGRGGEARATLSEALESIVGGDTTRDVMAARDQLAKYGSLSE